MELRVECRFESGEHVPVRFGSGSAMQKVECVVDRWPGSDHSYFRVRTPDGAHYILRHDEQSGGWCIHYLEAGGDPDRGVASDGRATLAS